MLQSFILLKICELQKHDQHIVKEKEVGEHPFVFLSVAGGEDFLVFAYYANRQTISVTGPEYAWASLHQGFLPCLLLFCCLLG